MALRDFAEILHRLTRSAVDNGMVVDSIKSQGFHTHVISFENQTVEDQQTVVVDDTLYVAYRRLGRWFAIDPNGQRYAIRDPGKSRDALQLRIETLHWRHLGKDRGSEPVRIYLLESLSTEEQRCVNEAVSIVREVDDTNFPFPIICDFAAGIHLCGTYHYASCEHETCTRCKGENLPPEIHLSRHILNDFMFTLEVLVHEVTHIAGEDGSEAHLQELQKVWAKIAVSLYNKTR